MKILFLNAYFAPEKIAFTHLENDLLEALVAAGHEIRVICPIPTRGISRDEAKRYSKIKVEEMLDGKVKVYRFWAPQEGHNPIIRAFRYFLCNLREYRIGRRFKDTDAIFAVSTPPTQGYLCGMLKKKLRCKFVYSLQDIFPDSLVTTGMAESTSIVYKMGAKIEKKTYKMSDKIITISEACKENLLDKGVPEDKIEMIYNWIDTTSVQPVSRCDNKLIEEYSINPSKFLVVYAGNFGAAQGAEIVLEVAEILQKETGIQFIVFGGGSGYEAAKEMVSKKQLPNVIMKPLLPQSRISEVYSLGDVALVTCKKGVGKSGMPSKIWSIMACNTPIMAAFDLDSELVKILKLAEAGECVPPGDAKALADSILEYSRNKRGYYCNARAYVELHSTSAIGTGRYCRLIEEMLK